MKPLTYQKAIKIFMYILAGFLGLGAVLDSVANAISLLTPLVASIGTACIVLGWLVAYILLPSHPRPRLLGNHHRTAYAVGMVLLLWMPSVIAHLQTLPSSSSDKGIPREKSKDNFHGSISQEISNNTVMGNFNAAGRDLIINGQNIDEDRIKRVNADIRATLSKCDTTKMMLSSFSVDSDRSLLGRIADITRLKFDGDIMMVFGEEKYSQLKELMNNFSRHIYGLMSVSGMSELYKRQDATMSELSKRPDPTMSEYSKRRDAAMSEYSKRREQIRKGMMGETNMEEKFETLRISAMETISHICRDLEGMSTLLAAQLTK